MPGEKFFSGILEEMTVEEIRSLKPNVGVIPIGSTEPHGPALPYGTDTFRVQGIIYPATRLANERGARVVCLPPQAISLNNNFYGLPFACRVSVPTFMSLVRDLVLFLLKENVRRVIIVNSHGGNPDVIKAVQRDLAETEGLFLGMVNPETFTPPEIGKVIEHPSDHGGEAETSQILDMKPGLVRKEKLGDFPRHYPRLESLRKNKVAFVRPWHLYLPESAGGEARYSTPEKGKKVNEASVEGMAEFLRELSGAPESPDFPY